MQCIPLSTRQGLPPRQLLWHQRQVPQRQVPQQQVHQLLVPQLLVPQLLVQ